jgi:TolA-binding protein
MPEHDRVLTQDEIDALLAKNAPKSKPRSAAGSGTVIVKPSKPLATAGSVTETDEPSRPPATTTPLTQVPKATFTETAPPQAVTVTRQDNNSKKMEDLQKSLTTLARQVAKLTNAMEKIDKLEEQIEQISGEIQITSEALSSLEKRTKKIQSTLRTAIQNEPKNPRNELPSSRGYSKIPTVFRVRCVVHEN